MDTFVRDFGGPVALIIDATFIISNRSALFEDAAAENSGHYRQRRFRFRAINPILSCVLSVHIWPRSPRSEAHSASFAA